jgi:hypothetical protein
LGLYEYTCNLGVNLDVESEIRGFYITNDEYGCKFEVRDFWEFDDLNGEKCLFMNGFCYGYYTQEELMVKWDEIGYNYTKPYEIDEETYYDET